VYLPGLILVFVPRYPKVVWAGLVFTVIDDFVQARRGQVRIDNSIRSL
jgi:hypothetical protein